MKSVKEVESRFNRKYRYPYVFLNDEPFTDEFKELRFCFFLFFFVDFEVLMMIRRGIAMLTPSRIEFGLIPKEHWSQPEWIDEERATIGRSTMKEKGIIYAGSVPYRNMCRFNSGVSPLRMKSLCVSLSMAFFFDNSFSSVIL